MITATSDNVSTRRRRLARGAAAVLACLAVSSSSFISGTAPAAPADDSSRPVSLSGSGPFAGLKVTVAQTVNLINQVDPVTWTGGAPTETPGNFNINYLQIMQCWSRSAQVQPDQTTCQFGGLNTSEGGTHTKDRQLNYGSTLIDPAQQPPVPQDRLPNTVVPFRPVGTQTGPTNRFFDNNTSNEIPFGRTRADGTGVAYVETQTAQQAPGLGCGQRQTSPEGDSYLPACWLVVVPRGDHEVDGTTVPLLLSSPLSSTNWQQRIVFPLSFQATSLTCPLSAQERQLTGQESFTTAVSSWQPTLCATGATYNYSQVSDDTARRLLVSTNPGLDFVSRGLDPALAPPDGPPVYAPVAVTGLTFAVNLDKNVADPTPAEDAQQGQRITSLNLTPRVVAKLLTQSYQFGAQYYQGPEPALKDNAGSLLADPDFLKDNPDLRTQLPSIADALVPFAPADAVVSLWNWINSDKDARAFLDGEPDPYGMTVNPAYRGLARGLDRLPKSDLQCHPIDPSHKDLPFCTLDQHPYASDFRDAARSASRGDSLVRNTYPASTPIGQKPTLSKGGLQPSGRRALIALSDTGTAARYALPTARLRNASGAFVAPDGEGLTAGLASMKPSGPDGLLQPDPTATDPAAYPLTQLTYAVTVPAKITKPQGADFADFLRYAAGPGQVSGVGPGQLPPGYLPLPQSFRQQTLAAADVVQSTAAVPIADSSADGSAPAEPAPGTPPVSPAPPSAGADTGAPSTPPATTKATTKATAKAPSAPRPGPASASASRSPAVAGPTAAPVPPAQPAPATGGEAPGSAGGPGAESGALPAASTPGGAASPGSSTTAPASSPQAPQVAALKTPATAMGASRYAFLGAALALLMAGLSGPLLLRRGRRVAPIPPARD